MNAEPISIPALSLDFSKLQISNRWTQCRPALLVGYPTCIFEAETHGQQHRPLTRLLAQSARPLEITELVYDLDHSAIFRGTLGIEDIILKFAPREDLEIEDVVYNEHLLPIQGRFVPRYYGLYSGRTQDGSLIYCCVMQCWGTSVAIRFQSLEATEQAKILHTLHQVHMHGIAPRDFAERNVVVKDGEYMIIDFEHFTEHPHCPWSYDFLTRTDAPRKEEREKLRQECVLLYQSATTSGLWDHGTVTFAGRRWRDPKLPSQEVIYRLDMCRYQYQYQLKEDGRDYGDWLTTSEDKQYWCYCYYRHVNRCLEEGVADLETLYLRKNAMFMEIRRKCMELVGYKHAPPLSEDIDLKTGKYELVEW